MKVVIEILSISEPREWGDRHVAFAYKLGIGSFQEGGLIVLVNDEWLQRLPSLLGEYTNMTRPAPDFNRWV